MHFLALQHTYSHVQAALVNEQLVMHEIQCSKIEAGSRLMSMLSDLLTQHNLTWKDLSFIAANQGPGPFTTMRVVIATINGIAFATGLPLIGIDGLDAFLDEHAGTKLPITLILLNAFNQDVYYALAANGKRSKGTMNCKQLLTTVAQQFPTNSICCLGQGVPVFMQDISHILGSRALIPDPLPEQCSLKMIAHHALKKWERKEGLSQQLLPLYLKKQTSAGTTVIFQ